MPQPIQSSSYTQSSYSTSSTQTTTNGQTTGFTQTSSSHTDPSGTTFHSSHQTHGEPPQTQTRHFDTSGRELLDERSSAGRIEDVSASQSQTERDAQYEERIEDEYARREGGA